MIVYEDPKPGDPRPLNFKGTTDWYASGFVDTNGNAVLVPNDGQVVTIDCPEFGGVEYTVRSSGDGKMYAINGNTMATMHYDEERHRWVADGFICCPYLPEMSMPIVSEDYSPTKGFITRYGKKLLAEGKVP